MANGFRLGVISQELEESGMNGLIEERDADEYQIAYNSDLDGQKVDAGTVYYTHLRAHETLR